MRHDITTTRRSALAGGALAVGALAGCDATNAGGIGSGRTRLDLAHVGDIRSPQQRIAELLAEALAAEAEDIELVVHDSGTLGDEAELQGAAIDGTIDLVIAASFSHFAPWAGVLEAPMLFRSNEDFRAFAHGSVGESVLTDLADELGTVPLFIAPHEGPRAITTANTPIRYPDDLRGLKLRNPEVPAYTVMANAVEAVPVALDFSELYLALDRGVVDGQHNPLGHVVGQSFYEVQGYLNMVPWGITPHVVTMSRYTWDRLTPEQQEAVCRAADTVSAGYFDVAAAEREETLESLQGSIEIVAVGDIDIDTFEAVFDGALPALARQYDEHAMGIVDAILGAR